MDANLNVKKILFGVVVLILGIYGLNDCSCSCGSGSVSAGKYEYTDAVGHEFSLILKKDGSATLKMTSGPKSELDEIAYRGVREEGVTGRWRKEAFCVGEGTMDYLDIYIDGENLMLCADGYIYNDFDSMLEGNTLARNKWSR